LRGAIASIASGSAIAARRAIVSLAIAGAWTTTSPAGSRPSTPRRAGPLLPVAARERLGHLRVRGVRGLGEREVDARLLEVDARDLHAHAIGQPERSAAALAGQRVVDRDRSGK
jgi:hypothetical protein